MQIDVQPRSSSRMPTSHETLTEPIRVRTPSLSGRNTPKSPRKKSSDGKQPKKSAKKGKKEKTKEPERPKTVEPVPPISNTDVVVGCPFIDFGCDLMVRSFPRPSP